MQKKIFLIKGSQIFIMAKNGSQKCQKTAIFCIIAYSGGLKLLFFGIFVTRFWSSAYSEVLGSIQGTYSMQKKFFFNKVVTNFVLWPKTGHKNTKKQ